MGKIKIHIMEKIQEIKNVSSWNTSDGTTMYTFLMVLESGKSGEVNAKTNDRYSVGETVWITSSQSTNYGDKWKMSKNRLKIRIQFLTKMIQIICILMIFINSQSLVKSC